MLQLMMILFSVLYLAGCATYFPAETPKDIITYKAFNAPLGKLFEVKKGDAVFVEGEFVEGEAILISNEVDIMFPGSTIGPSPVHINPGKLTLSTVTSSWKYYCADAGKANASFPGMGRSIHEDDCVGIRISLNGLDYDWIVDKSRFNKGYEKGSGETIRTRRMSTEEQQKYKPEITKIPFKINTLKSIVYNGFYENMLHFSYEETTNAKKESTQFTFDFPGKPTAVGIRGNQFIVHSADNAKMMYEWTKIDSSR